MGANAAASASCVGVGVGAAVDTGAGDASAAGWIGPTDEGNAQIGGGSVDVNCDCMSSNVFVSETVAGGADMGLNIEVGGIGGTPNIPGLLLVVVEVRGAPPPMDDRIVVGGIGGTP